MQNSRTVATVVLILMYSVLRTWTWNRPVGFSDGAGLDWWLCIAREISFYLMSIFLAWELWKNKSLQQRFFAGRFGRPDSKLNFAFGAIAFFLIIAAIVVVIVVVIVPYRTRVEHTAGSDVSLSAESNIALERDN